jgi:hypothetical protein
MMKRRRRINVHPTNKTESIREEEARGEGKEGERVELGEMGRERQQTDKMGELVNGERREISHFLTDE